MYQIVVERKLMGRGIFVTEDRNEPNTAFTPTPHGIEERPVILGRKLAAKERRTLLEVRNKMKDVFPDEGCYITPTSKEGGGIEGLCMHCPVCYTHGGLKSGPNGSYGRAGIVLYDDAFNLGDSEIENLTLNSVDMRTYRTGTALASETFVYGGTFVNVVTIKDDSPEILNLILDSIVSTGSYGARTRHYGRMKNNILLIAQGERPMITSYEIVGLVNKPEDIKPVAEKIITERNGRILPVPVLGDHREIIKAANNIEEVQNWYKEVDKYIRDSKKSKKANGESEEESEE
ncbi:MAG: type I-D CRISPR-associated protein Cas7/Csc2 [Thermoplasmata archaeon]